IRLSSVKGAGAALVRPPAQFNLMFVKAAPLGKPSGFFVERAQTPASNRIITGLETRLKYIMPCPARLTMIFLI
ncbi:hypothetical protein, partial [Enterobacter intestinihominis]